MVPVHRPEGRGSHSTQWLVHIVIVRRIAIRGCGAAAVVVGQSRLPHAGLLSVLPSPARTPDLNRSQWSKCSFALTTSKPENMSDLASDLARCPD